MSAPTDTIWEIEPHTSAKHKILENYLQAWFPILNRYNERIIYLDGFCGPGRYSGGEPGSPLIAINTALTHRRKMTGELVFIFVDEAPDRIANLKSELSRIGLPEHFKVHAECGKFDEVIGGILDKLEIGRQSLAPTFAFVDPFGFSGVPFALLEKLLVNPKCEIFVTFMVDWMNRFLESPNEAIRDHIVEFFGTSDVLKVADLGTERKARLLEYYKERLSTKADYVREFEMRNEEGRVIYYLVFATKNSLGHLKMKEAMWRVDTYGDYRFSDKTNPDQVVLFRLDHGTPLCNILFSKFTGRKIQVRDAIAFVCDVTPYIEKHVRPALKYAEERGMIVVDESKADGRKRRPGTFPPNSFVTFQ